jgi:hypothetical protein
MRGKFAWVTRIRWNKDGKTRNRKEREILVLDENKSAGKEALNA